MTQFPVIIGNSFTFRRPRTTVSSVEQKRDEERFLACRMEGLKTWVAADKMDFKGNCDLPIDVKKVSMPIQFFKYFSRPDLVQHIVCETNRYSTSSNVNQPANVTVSEMWKYHEICLMSTVMQCKHFRLH